MPQPPQLVFEISGVSQPLMSSVSQSSKPGLHDAI